MKELLEVKNLLNEADQLDSLYTYKKIGLLNGNIFNVVQAADRTLDFHVHPHSDELFYVIEGEFTLETRDQQIKVGSGEFIIVPKEVEHRPVVASLTKFLMVELDGTLNKENSGNSYKQI